MEQKGKYAGADWVEGNLKYWKKGGLKMSELGVRVADLLGELFNGIYHLDDKQLAKVEWDNDHHICFSLGWRSLATTDFNDLTRLVFLAHHLSLRVEIEASTHNFLRFIFHPRKRSGAGYGKHPTLDEAVMAFKKNVSLPEYIEGSL